ncbi:MAG: preprotein translocase subunit SecG [Candidatus Beckwithbacteria bacterium]|nr:preprotein translocase subunit SecG [Candidatus Beckwithbacteria bacterium]
MSWLIILQIIISLLLIGLILLQAKGTGLSSTFGGQSQAYHSKRGMEKTVFLTTIVLAVAFVIVSLFNFHL